MPCPPTARNAFRSSLPHLRAALLALLAGLALALAANGHSAASTPAGAPGRVVEGTSADSNSADEIDLGAIPPKGLLFSDSNSADDVDLG